MYQCFYVAMCNREETFSIIKIVDIEESKNITDTFIQLKT